MPEAAQALALLPDVSEAAAGPDEATAIIEAPPPEAAVSALIDRLETKPTPVVLKLVKMTREFAVALLDTRPSAYRNASDGDIAKVAHDMSSGAWRDDTGQPVKISPNGRLVDGQHRLLAFLKSGLPFLWMECAFGVPEDTELVQDTGRPRSLRDNFKYMGAKNPSALAVVIRRAVMWHRGVRTNAGGGARGAVSNSEATRYLEGNILAVEAAAFGAMQAKDAGVSPSMLAFGYYVCALADYEAAREFFSRVADGVGLERGEQAWLFRQRIMRSRTTDDRALKLNPDATLALMIIAFNAFHEGRTITRLLLPPARLTSSNFPVPR